MASKDLIDKINILNWYPLKRDNKIDIHPFFFGVYGNLIYHHGGGFRTMVSDYDIKMTRDNRSVKLKNTRGINENLSEKIYGDILKDPLFYQKFF
jgi:hypothetical protein